MKEYVMIVWRKKEIMMKMNHNKRMKLQKHVDWLMSRGVKDKGRSKKPALTNNYGNIIKTRRILGVK
tara:strand:+ start:302 stop:502 length:201 start_codon:yes stop_codon:yes gene_type:complete